MASDSCVFATQFGKEVEAGYSLPYCFWCHFLLQGQVLSNISYESLFSNRSFRIITLVFKR